MAHEFKVGDKVRGEWHSDTNTDCAVIEGVIVENPFDSSLSTEFIYVETTKVIENSPDEDMLGAVAAWCDDELTLIEAAS